MVLGVRVSGRTAVIEASIVIVVVADVVVVVVVVGVVSSESAGEFGRFERVSEEVWLGAAVGGGTRRFWSMVPK